MTQGLRTFTLGTYTSTLLWALAMWGPGGEGAVENLAGCMVAVVLTVAGRHAVGSITGAKGGGGGLHDREDRP